jgi:hypothetical protein
MPFTLATPGLSFYSIPAAWVVALYPAMLKVRVTLRRTRHWAIDVHSRFRMELFRTLLDTTSTMISFYSRY